MGLRGTWARVLRTRTVTIFFSVVCECGMSWRERKKEKDRASLNWASLSFISHVSFIDVSSLPGGPKWRSASLSPPLSPSLSSFPDFPALDPALLEEGVRSNVHSSRFYSATWRRRPRQMRPTNTNVCPEPTKRRHSKELPAKEVVEIRRRGRNGKRKDETAPSAISLL